MTDRNQPPSRTAAKSGRAAVATDPQVEAALDPALQVHIGRQLRALYDEVVQQPVPDRFVQLLEELERKKGDGA